MDPEATIEAFGIDFWSNAVPMEWKVFCTASHQLAPSTEIAGRAWTGNPPIPVPVL